MTYAQDLGNNVVLQWNNEKTQVTYTLSASRRDAVDTYIESNLDILKNWDHTKTLYTIQDISDDNVALTPYLRERLNEITDYVKDNHIQVRTSVVLSDNLTGQLMQVFGRVFTINAKYLKQAYFTDMLSAQSWINKQQAN